MFVLVYSVLALTVFGFRRLVDDMFPCSHFHHALPYLIRQSPSW